MITDGTIVQRAEIRADKCVDGPGSVATSRLPPVLQKAPREPTWRAHNGPERMVLEIKRQTGFGSVARSISRLKRRARKRLGERAEW
jgi:hypothetical protein